MRAILALVWREYRELRGAVLAVACILLVLPLVYVGRGQMPWAADAVGMILTFYPVFGGALFGMRAAAGERGDHSAAFVNALPERAAMLGMVRLLATVAAVLLPVLALAAVSFTLLPEDLRNPGPQLPWCMAWSLLVTLVVATCGIGASSELEAAGRGLAVAAGCWVAVSASLVWLPHRVPLPDARLHPVQSLISFFRDRSSVIVPLISVALATAFVWRYRWAIGPRPVAGSRPARAWMPAHLRWSSAALALKAAREERSRLAAVPLAAMPLAIGMFLLGVGRGSGIFMTVMACGAVAAMLVGIAAFAADLDPRINTFWRSRPICPTRWFWTKYVAALVTFLIMLGLPQLGLLASDSAARGAADLTRGFIMVAGGWFVAFSAGVIAICLVRRPLAAAVCAGGPALAVPLVIGWYLPWGSGPHAAVVSFGCAVAASIAAWWAFSRDVAIIR